MHQDTIRLFVSSTFSDFQAERAALHNSVFPRLRELCESQGITFQAIDLRWGVSSEHVRRHQTMDICLEEVRRSLEESPQPNFLGMLGDRWGWQPVPSSLRQDLFESLKQAMHTEDDMEFLESCYPDSSLDKNAVPPVRSLQLDDVKNRVHIETRLRGLMEAQVERLPFTEDEKLFLSLSATGMEFQIALLAPVDSASLHDSALVIDRSIVGLPSDPGSEPYLDVQGGLINPLHKERVLKLKQRLCRLLKPSRFLAYSERWLGQPDGAVTHGPNPEISHDQLPEFTQQVFETLTEQIKQKLASQGERSTRQTEHELHAKFGAEACRVFAGRSEELASLVEILKSNQTQQTATLLIGAAGGGTTTLIARAVADYAKVIDRRLIVRYINSSPTQLGDVWS